MKASITLSSLRSLSYLRDDCHKQAVLISESRGDSNQYTPCMEKPDQHAKRFPQSVCIWSSTIHISRGSRVATFCVVINRVEQEHCSWEKKAPDIIYNTTAYWSVGQYPISLPSQLMKQWGQSQPPVDGRLLGLPGLYTNMRSVRSILARGGQHISP
jgi:hypothetical protein